MGKNRVRPAKGGKPARWAKGQSSSSNPTKNRHRTKAKSTYFQYLTGEETGGADGLGSGKLTAAALMRHDALQGDTDAMQTSLDRMSIRDETLTLGMTNKTFDTFASDWTQCTNIAFDKLLKKFQLKNAHHKEMLAVLAAVTEIIKEQGGAETETEYFAALMSTLEVSETIENLSAIVRLLSLVIRKVPKEVLINRSSQVLQLLLETLSKHADSQNVSLIRGLLGCLSHALRVQPPAAWAAHPEIANVYQCVLTYTTHTKPKIRKAGQHATVAVARGGGDTPTGGEATPPSTSTTPVHPAASQAGQHCLNVIKNAGPGENSVLYMMVLLRALLPTLPKNITKLCCETILKLLTLGTKIIISTGFSSLYGLFSERPGVNTLPAELNGQLISALYDYKPNISDTGPIVAWLAVQQEGLLNLSQQNLQLAQSHLHRFCSEAATCWASPKPEVVKAAGLALRAVLTEASKSIGRDTCAKVIEELSAGLKYQYHTAWSTVLAVLGTLVSTVGSQHPQLLYPVLQNIADLRGNDNVKLEKEVDFVVGKAVASMGPRQVLEAVPLNITGDEKDYEFKRSWLIPVMRDHISRTDLAFFLEYFLPLAAKCLDRSKYAASQGDNIGHKTYQVLTYQIWSLLPGFCTEPTDISTSFKNIAKILGTQLSSRKEIRLDIMTGLRHLVTSSLEVPADKAELARFAKNFLPILFNLYTTKPGGSEEAGQRLAALETIKLYLKVSDVAMIASMFDKAMEKGASEGGSDEFTKEAILDLLRCLLVHVDAPRILTLYKNAITNLTSKDHKEQKKTYKILDEICKCDTEAAKQFLHQNLSELQSSLLTSLSKTSPSSQYPRLKCLISILAKLQEPQPEFASACLPEAVLCIKAANKKARESAFLLLISVAEAMMRWNPDEPEQVLRDFACKVMAGFKDTPTVIQCSILAICKLYYQFKDIIPQDLTEQILKNVLLLMSSGTRDISSSALSFIKVFITSTPLGVSTQFLPDIMKGITEMPEDGKRHSRVKTKFLLDRLTRKFGHDLVASLVPKADVTTHKRLRNIRKEISRKNRQNEDGAGGNAGSDDDEMFAMAKSRQKTMDELLADSSDDELDFDDGEDGGGGGKAGSRRGAAAGSANTAAKKSASGTFIQEGDDILDLLSSQAASKISTVRPVTAAAAEAKQQKRKAKKKEEFKMSSDGRLIITEDMDDGDGGDDTDDDHQVGGQGDGGGGQGGGGGGGGTGAGSDEEETFESLVATKKRKIGSETASVRSRMSTTSKGESMYKPGGSGIHRPLAPGSEYKSKKSRGDVKLKGRPDPYAYIPMSHKSLNKRKSAGVQKKSVFKNLVKAAKRGAAKGAKYKAKDAKKKM